MKYLDCFGGVWKLSERSYRRFLRNAAEGKDWNLNDYGRMIAANTIHVTDLTAEMARELIAGVDPSYVIPERDDGTE